MDVKKYLKEIGGNLPIYRQAKIGLPVEKNKDKILLVTNGESLRGALSSMYQFDGVIISDAYAASILMREQVQPDIIVLTGKEPSELLILLNLPVLYKYVVANINTNSIALYSKIPYNSVIWFYQYPLHGDSKETILVADLIEALFEGLEIEALPFTDVHEFVLLLASAIVAKQIDSNRLITVGFDFHRKRLPVMHFDSAGVSPSLAAYSPACYKPTPSPVFDYPEDVNDVFVRVLLDLPFKWLYDLSHNRAKTNKVSFAEVMK